MSMLSRKKFRLGILGCGAISADYLKGAVGVFSNVVEVAACSDIVVEKAEARAKEYNVPKVCSPEEMMDDPEIDIIVNLTIPAVHDKLTIACLKHGKHVYTEKPLAITRAGAKEVAKTANSLGLRVGSAPDTFMNAPVQTAKKIIEDGWIGEPIGVTAICPMRGNEYFRPDADFFYKKGAGPMLDNAPYWLNIMVNLMGPIKSVVAQSRITFPERTIKVPPRRGEKIQVEVPTFVSGVFEFETGAIGTFINSFDIWKSKTPFIEVYGEKGSLIFPDSPGLYYGELLISRFGDSEWHSCPQLNEYANFTRGIGIADMVRGIQTNTPHRANLELAYHTIDVMLAFEESAEEGVKKMIASKCKKPTGLWETEDIIFYYENRL
jgi:predicted dehydrogenase